jgi:hypothetical protein
VFRDTPARVGDSLHEEVECMDTMPRCQDCGGLIKVSKRIGGRRARSIQYCERCTERHNTLEAAEKRRTIMSAVGALIAIAALLFFLLARG